MRVGETRPRKVDVRVISATNRDLQQAVQDSSFAKTSITGCEWWRSTCRRCVQRKDDILALALHFVEEMRRAPRLGGPPS